MGQTEDYHTVLSEHDHTVKRSPSGPQLLPYLLWTSADLPSKCVALLSVATLLMFSLNFFSLSLSLCSLTVSLSTGSPVVTQNVTKSTEQPRPQPGTSSLVSVFVLSTEGLKLIC